MALSDIGTLCIRVGPMFSGKSTWLNNELTAQADRGFKVLKINHSLDDRPNINTESSGGSTHSSGYYGLSSKIDYQYVSALSHVVDVEQYTFIGIDEGQFFPDLVEYVKIWVDTQKRHLLVCGLDGDYKREKFGQIADLLPLADDFKKLRGTCRICMDQLILNQFQGPIPNNTGIFTAKKDRNNTNQIDIGGEDKYIQVCRFHYFEVSN